MNFPQFTAEASLFRTQFYYRATAAIGSFQSLGITPADACDPGDAECFCRFTGGDPCGLTCCPSGTRCANSDIGLCCNPQTEFGCGNRCCSGGQHCTNGVCCQPGEIGCGGRCCASGMVCSDSSRSLCCNPGSTVCNGTCCPMVNGQSQRCINGMCCPPDRSCGHLCCGPLDRCCDP